MVCCAMWSYTMQAQSRTLTKNISQTFLVEEGATIDITNKYGQITIETWDMDSVAVDVEITAYGKNDIDLDKTMARVDIEFDNFDDLLNIETVLDRNSNTFKEIWNSLGDYSKNLISKNKISIDYVVKIPDHCDIELDNKFGNIFVNEISEELRVTLAHGDLKANELTGSTKIDLSFGRARIKEASKAIFNLKSAELSLRKGGEVHIESSASTLDFTSVQSLKMNSRNDKMDIEEVKVLKGRSSFTQFSIDSVLDIADVTLNYGELQVYSINSNFSQVNVKSKSTDVNLNFSMGAYFTARLTGLEQTMFLTKNFMGLEKSRDQENKEMITLIGAVGYKKAKLSHVNIESESGELMIYLEDAGAITNNK